MRGLRWTDDEWMSRRHQMLDELSSLVLPEWPVYAPAGGGVIRHWETRDGAVTSLDIAVNMGDPSGLVVVSIHAAGHPPTAPYVDAMLGRPLRMSMWQPPLQPHIRVSSTPTVDDVRLSIDGVDHPAQRRHHDTATTYEVTTEQFAMQAILMNDPDLTPPQLVRVRDLSPYIERSAALWPEANPTTPQTWRDPAAWQHPPDRSVPFWAHHNLIHRLLELRPQQHRSDRESNPDYGLWWAAAEHEQARLTGQTAEQARDAVDSMAQLVLFLADRALWWSVTDVRAKAINHIVWNTATDDTTLSSAAATKLWRHHYNRHRGRHPFPESMTGSVIEAWNWWAAT
jgi:hypothetical protein